MYKKIPIPYTYYELLRNQDFSGIWGKEGIAQEIREAEELNPEWKYRIVRNYLNKLLGYEETIS